MIWWLGDSVTLLNDCCDGADPTKMVLGVLIWYHTYSTHLLASNGRFVIVFLKVSLFAISFIYLIKIHIENILLYENFAPFCKIIQMAIRSTTPSWCIEPFAMNISNGSDDVEEIVKNRAISTPFSKVIQMSIGSRAPSRRLKSSFDKIIEMTIGSTPPSGWVKPGDK